MGRLGACAQQWGCTCICNYVTLFVHHPEGGDIPAVLSRETVHVTTEQVDAARAAVPQGASEQTPVLGILDGGQFAALPEPLQPLLNHLLDAVAEGRRVTVSAMPEALTTTLAAEMLGISRPTLMKRIRSGEIPSHKVGSHTRVLTEDLLEFQRQELEARKKAFDDLREAQDDAGLID